MTEAEYGRAVLALVDTALDALSSTDIGDLAAFRCGTATVRIRTSGAPRSEYLPFSHLPTAPGPDDAAPTATELVVHVSDGPFPAAEGRRPPAGFHRARDDRTFVAVTDDPPIVEGVRMPDSRALSWIEDIALAPPYMRFRPFAEILSAWFPTVGMVLLHAAAVGDADGVVLLVGNGGSGKSTTSVVCSRAGLGFLADDFCLLEPGAPPRVHSIYRSAKLRHDSASRVPDLHVAPGDRFEGDQYFLVDEAATIASAPVRAIVAVRGAVDPTGAPHLERTTRDEMFPLLLPTALKLSTGGEVAYRRWLRCAHMIAETVPAFTLELTWDTSRVVDRVREALRGHPSRRHST